ncbi:Uma2 family endonuclease [Trinickia violacea]|uniref:Uma2 family endonuclease n=1 Tax=Trinickia violacea TaxID=2571746 RepID=A0A4P8ITZ5_9BURK|nr:Uma2 family endonuclease [Trinickia violacea]
MTNSQPSARRQIVVTDVFCQITEQMGHLAAMCVAVTTPMFGIRVPDVVWMPCERWESFDHDDPVPFVPDLCVEVLLDTDRTQELDRRIASYLGGGAREVIVIDRCGQVQFWGLEGRRPASVLGVSLSLEPMYFDEGTSSAPVVH